eukprot:2005563-Prymnesium_polylepis.1
MLPDRRCQVGSPHIPTSQLRACAIGIAQCGQCRPHGARGVQDGPRQITARDTTALGTRQSHAHVQYAWDSAAELHGA